MYCSSSLEISLFGSLFFVGVAISTLTMKYGDMLGRRNYFLIGAIISTVSTWGILFWSN